MLAIIVGVNWDELIDPDGESTGNVFTTFDKILVLYISENPDDSEVFEFSDQNFKLIAKVTRLALS